MQGAMKTLKNIMRSLYMKARGNAIWELKLFGVQLVLIAQPDKWHTNVFLFYIPVLRIDTEPTKFGINLLILTWFYKVIKYMFTKWEYVRKENEIQLFFCGLNVYHRKDVVPFRFPTAMFRG